MVNLLIGSKEDIKEIDILRQELTNDKDYQINNVYTGKQFIDTYWKLNPDIVIVDNTLADFSVEDIINNLSSAPIEEKKCNMILTLNKNYKLNLDNFSKINKVLYKPINDNNKLIESVKKLAMYYNTPDIENGEIDLLLQSLNFNCMSAGYRYMRDAIIYCYYRPNELEFLNNILKHLSYQYQVPITRIRDALNSSIRPFNSTQIYKCPIDLTNLLYTNNNLSLKDFLERIVFYLIKEKQKGRIF